MTETGIENELPYKINKVPYTFIDGLMLGMSIIMFIDFVVLWNWGA